MTLIRQKTPSYLVKHRRKWQVKLTIPRDVRWAFENKTTFKRSTGCNIIDIKQALIERDTIVESFKRSVELHRSSMTVAAKEEDLLGENLNYLPHPLSYQSTSDSSEHSKNSNVDGWIKERLLNKAGNRQVLRYDFWGVNKTKV